MRLRSSEAVTERNSCEAESLRTRPACAEGKKINKNTHRSTLNLDFPILAVTLQPEVAHWVVFREFRQTGRGSDSSFGQRDASTSRAVNAVAAMATGP